MAVVSLRPATASDSGFAFAVKKAAFRQYVERAIGWNEAEQKELHRQRFASQDFRVVHHSIQRDHLHLIVEAEGHDALGRGMNSISAAPGGGSNVK